MKKYFSKINTKNEFSESNNNNFAIDINSKFSIWIHNTTLTNQSIQPSNKTEQLLKNFGISKVVSALLKITPLSIGRVKHRFLLPTVRRRLRQPLSWKGPNWGRRFLPSERWVSVVFRPGPFVSVNREGFITA